MNNGAASTLGAYCMFWDQVCRKEPPELPVSQNEVELKLKSNFPTISDTEIRKILKLQLKNCVEYIHTMMSGYGYSLLECELVLKKKKIRYCAETIEKALEMVRSNPPAIPNPSSNANPTTMSNTPYLPNSSAISNPSSNANPTTMSNTPYLPNSSAISNPSSNANPTTMSNTPYLLNSSAISNPSSNANPTMSNTPYLPSSIPNQAMANLSLNPNLSVRSNQPYLPNSPGIPNQSTILNASKPNSPYMTNSNPSFTPPAQHSPLQQRNPVYPNSPSHLQHRHSSNPTYPGPGAAPYVSNPNLQPRTGNLIYQPTPQFKDVAPSVKPPPRAAGPPACKYEQSGFYCRSWNLKYNLECKYHHDYCPGVKLKNPKPSFVELTEKSSNYQTVKTHFLSSWKLKSPPKVTKIEQVHCPDLKELFELKEEEFIANKHGIKTTLFHGTCEANFDTLFEVGLSPPADFEPSPNCPKSGPLHGKILTSLCKSNCKYCSTQRKHVWNKCHMYGLGIYFADQSSKSDIYVSDKNGNKSHTTNRKMIICEVLLGNSYVMDGELKTPDECHDYVKPPKGYDSIFAKANPTGKLGFCVRNNECT